MEVEKDGLFSSFCLKILHHGERKFGDTHRFATTEDPEDFASKVGQREIFGVIEETLLGTSLCRLGGNGNRSFVEDLARLTAQSPGHRRYDRQLRQISLTGNSLRFLFSPFFAV